jgi:PAS domain S-box-containing protein
VAKDNAQGGSSAQGSGSDATESAEWLRVTLASIGDGVITTDRHGRVTFLNPVAETLTGWTQPQAVSRSLQQVFHIVNEDTRAEVENPALRALREGVIVGLANHTLLISRDGTERPIDDSAAPIRNSKGEVAGCVLVFRDITERKRAERAQAWLAAIVESSDDAIVSKTLDGVITSWNRGAERLFGYTPEEAIGRHITLIIPSDRHSEEDMVISRVGQGQKVEHYETVRQTKDGKRVPVSLTVSPIRDSAGQIIGASKIARDITDRVLLEEQIKGQAEDLAYESRRKDEFLAMLSHELRNPLAPIRAAVHLLKVHTRGTETLIQHQACEILERQVANLTKLVNDLMEVSRVVSGRIRLDMVPVDLNRVVRHALETVQPYFEQRRHTTSMRPCGQPVWVNADATRIEEVFVNLLDNAAKYTPDGGRIDVTCECEDRNAVIRLRDNGVGIEKSLLPHIFELFTQASRSLDRSAGGLGIGLSLAKQLVEIHGGTIEAISPPNGQTQGSEFVVSLPLVEAPAVQQTTAAESAEYQPEGRRVLVVDDNIDFVMMLATALRHKGYSVQSAYTGPDGLKVALQWRPDIAVLDIGLPGLDGYQVARRLRADPSTSSTRLIAVTGYGRDIDVSQAKEAGFDNHLVKPIDVGDLERKIAVTEKQ